MRCSDSIKSMSSENNTDANKQNLNNNYNNLNPFMMGMDLWQNAQCLGLQPIMNLLRMLQK